GRARAQRTMVEVLVMAGPGWATMVWGCVLNGSMPAAILIAQGARHDPVTSMHDSRDGAAPLFRAHRRVVPGRRQRPGRLLRVLARSARPRKSPILPPSSLDPTQ